MPVPTTEPMPRAARSTARQVLLEFGVFGGFVDLGRGFRFPDAHAMPLISALRRRIISQPGRKAIPAFDNLGLLRYQEGSTSSIEEAPMEDPSDFDSLGIGRSGRRPGLVLGRRHLAGPGFDPSRGHGLPSKVPQLARVPGEEHPLRRTGYRLEVHRPHGRADRAQAAHAGRLLLSRSPGRGHSGRHGRVRIAPSSPRAAKGHSASPRTRRSAGRSKPGRLRARSSSWATGSGPRISAGTI